FSTLFEPRPPAWATRISRRLRITVTYWDDPDRPRACAAQRPRVGALAQPARGSPELPALMYRASCGLKSKLKVRQRGPRPAAAANESASPRIFPNGTTMAADLD